MRLRFLWPGRTRSPEFRALEEAYLEKIERLQPAEVVVTREAAGLREKDAARVMAVEARGLEKCLSDSYIVCLTDGGREMTSEGLASFLAKRNEAARDTAFVVGGFLGLDRALLERADLKLSLSRMTFSHELSRVMLLEQVYRALTMIRGRKYAK
jgi:23S rRNA (pseudouridine1915-N3)-methyltransferase